MADRLDPNSVANLHKFDNAGVPSTDTWATLVTHITGFPVPDRNTLFDTLRSDHGGKLFRMDIKERGLDSAVRDIKETSLDTVDEKSGFLTKTGEDYDIWFFDSGKKESIMQARIVFEGRLKSDDEVIFDGPNSDNVRDAQVREGNEFTDDNKDKMSTIPLARYMNGPRAALLALLGGGTQDARFSNLGVPGADAVDLNSFNTTGESFDFAAKFFKDHAVVLKDWEDRFGRDDASWKGEAAEVFRSLLKKIRDNYDSYVETFNSMPGSGGGTGTGNTVYSRALSLGRKYLEDSANKLLEAWLAWAKSPYYDPHRVLRYVLDDLAQWVDANNVAKTEITSTSSESSTTVSHSPLGDFSQVHPEYGDLTEIVNWAKVGDKAVKIWSQGVDEFLGKPAAQVQSDLNNHFVDLGMDFSGNVPKPKSTSTASAEHKERKAKEEINRQNEENRKAQNELRGEQRREQEEAKHRAEEQRKAVERNLGGLNGPNAVNERNLGNLDGLRNRNNPVTESLGKLGDVNNPSGDDQQRSSTNPPPITQSLGNPGALNNGPGGTNNSAGAANEAITQSLGNPGALNNGPGGTNNSAGAANDAITQNLGNLGGLNGPNNGAGGSLRTPTGGDTQLTDGKLTTDFPDGSSTAFDADSGVLTTTHPDGSVTTQNLGDGTRVTNPDGSVTSLGDDGKLTTTFPDGTIQTADPANGQAITTDPDGTTTTENLGNLGNLNGQNGLGDLGDLGDINSGLTTESIGDLGNLNSDRSGLETPTGGRTALDDGDFTTAFPDGSKATFDPANGLLTTTHPDGTTTTADLTHGAKVTNPDGSTTVLDNGRLATTFPDGSTQVIDPDTGVATVTDPQGKTETVDLRGLNSAGNVGSSDIPGGLNESGGGDRTTTRDVPVSELGLGGGNVSAAGSGGGLVGAGSFSSDGVGVTGAAPLSDSAAGSTGTPLTAAAAPGAPGMPGMPMGGMPMGGMGGMGAGGERGNGERVRAVLVDAVEVSERRNRRRRSPWNRQEDNDTFLAPASRVATTGGDSPEEEAEPGRRPTSSADYLEEEADVWGTEQGGTPAVIGR
ncbi:AAWKG family protein [Streptomyces sp. NPDC054841]